MWSSSLANGLRRSASSFTSPHQKTRRALRSDSSSRTSVTNSPRARTGTKLGVTLPPGTYGVAVVRRLMMDRALESWWQVDTTAIDVDGARPRTVREMFEAFVRRSRDEVERRLRRQQLPADARLEVIEGLLRMAADERLSALVDAAESKEQARWALTHLGTLELTVHPRLGFHAVTAAPFSERQASAIVETMGLHREAASARAGTRGSGRGARGQGVSLQAGRNRPAPAPRTRASRGDGGRWSGRALAHRCLKG